MRAIKASSTGPSSGIHTRSGLLGYGRPELRHRLEHVAERRGDKVLRRVFTHTKRREVSLSTLNLGVKHYAVAHVSKEFANARSPVSES